MGIALNDLGQIIINETTGLYEQVIGQESLEQDARSECRCEQQGWFADPDYGRNPLVWKLPTTQSDKVADIKRIVTKYYEPQTITPSSDGLFEVT
jgi:hypothetical protein